MTKEQFTAELKELIKKAPENLDAIILVPQLDNENTTPCVFVNGNAGVLNETLLKAMSQSDDMRDLICDAADEFLD